MSGVNVACNQMGEGLSLNGAGEVKFHVTKDPNLATCIAAEVVNDILESALDIATMGDNAFTMEECICTFPQQDETRIREIVEGFNSIRVPTQNAEEPPRLDVEMKRLLNEMMSPSDVNYECIPRKDGVGDQPVEEVKEEENTSEECLVDADKIKVVEKKTRVTDLVMNSKQVLTELLMSEDTRNKQAEWEENNEMVLQVIELDCIKPEEGTCFKHKHLKEEEIDDEEEKVTLTPVPQDECLVNIDLTKKEKIELIEPENKIEDLNSLAGSSFSKESNESKDKMKNKFDTFCKKWNINFKLFPFGKKKQKGREEKMNF